MPTSLSVRLAKAILKLFPAYPSDEYCPLERITDEPAMARFIQGMEDERAGGFLRYFDIDGVTPGEILLDLGSGFGGRSVEFQRETGACVVGLEVYERMAASALRFARSSGLSSVFFLAGLGESLPFLDASIGTIFAYDVLEHVEDPARCLAECGRVLRDGGLLFLVFPPWFHPTGAHLEGYVSRIPYSNVLFPTRVLTKAVAEILEERNDGYKPQPLRPTDRLFTLNGLTVRGFKKILKASDFEIVYLRLAPLFSKLNKRYVPWRMRYYAWLIAPLSRIPLIQEFFTHRIVAILRKRK